jgi:hypothetical protein
MRDEHSTELIKCSIESPDTLKEKNGINAVRVFRHVLTRHGDDFFMDKLSDPTDKFGVTCPNYYTNLQNESIVDEEPVPNDIGEGSAQPGKSDIMEKKLEANEKPVADDDHGEGEAHSGKSDTVEKNMDDVHGTPQRKNTYFQDARSVSSDEGGEDKQEPSLCEGNKGGEDNKVEVPTTNEATNVVTQSQELSVTEARKRGEDISVEGPPNTEASNLPNQSQEPSANEATNLVPEPEEPIVQSQEPSANEATNLVPESEEPIVQSQEPSANEATNLVPSSEEPIVQSQFYK